MMTRKSAKKLRLIIMFLGFLMLTACGTTTGNSMIVSEAFSPSEAVFFAGFAPMIRSATLGESGWHSGPGGPLNDFRLCVRKVRLIDGNGNTKSKDGSEEIEFNAGLVDLTSGNRVQWGQVEIPTGFDVARLYIHLQRDDDLCPGFGSSIKVNEHASHATVILKFRFYPPITIEAGDTISLNVQTLARGLLTLANEGNLHSGNLKESAEQFEESAQKKQK